MLLTLMLAVWTLWMALSLAGEEATWSGRAGMFCFGLLAGTCASATVWGFAWLVVHALPLLPPL